MQLSLLGSRLLPYIAFFPGISWLPGPLSSPTALVGTVLPHQGLAEAVSSGHVFFLKDTTAAYITDMRPYQNALKAN